MKNHLNWIIAAFSVGTIGFLNAQQTDLVKVDGKVGGFTGIAVDTFVDGAIVLPSLAPADIFEFQVDQFMGPGEDVTVGGLFTAQIPSNFYLPTQKENYGIFPIGFGKEHFSIYAAPGEKKELIAAWFKVPFQSLLNLRNSGAAPTDLLPVLNIKKYAIEEAKDWSTQANVTLSLDKPLSTGVKFEWQRNAQGATEMDSIFLFQETKTHRWAFVNVKGKPAVTNEIASATGLENSFKITFVRTHNNDKGKVVSAEGWIRSTHFSEKAVVTGVPRAFDAVLASAEQFTWTPIQTPGWINLIVSTKDNRKLTGLLMVPEIFSGLLGKARTDFQTWIDPKLGTAATGLTAATFNGSSITAAFIGTAVNVPKPVAGADNSDFVDAASEIRMKKLK